MTLVKKLEQQKYNVGEFVICCIWDHYYFLGRIVEKEIGPYGEVFYSIETMWVCDSLKKNFENEGLPNTSLIQVLYDEIKFILKGI